jgi:serine/threonine-protein kinase RsbW
VRGLAVQAERLEIAAADWFPGNAEAVGQARGFVRAVLGGEWPGISDVVLMVSEIASNAVRHTASGDDGWFDLAVMASGCMVRVEISDRGSSSEPRIPENSQRSGVPTGGRGLHLVDALSDRWGSRGDELGRTVWFEVTAKPAD